MGSTKTIDLETLNKIADDNPIVYKRLCKDDAIGFQRLLRTFAPIMQLDARTYLMTRYRDVDAVLNSPRELTVEDVEKPRDKKSDSFRECPVDSLEFLDQLAKTTEAMAEAALTNHNGEQAFELIRDLASAIPYRVLLACLGFEDPHEQPVGKIPNTEQSLLQFRGHGLSEDAMPKLPKQVREALDKLCDEKSDPRNYPKTTRRFLRLVSGDGELKLKKRSKARLRQLVTEMYYGIPTCTIAVSNILQVLLNRPWDLADAATAARQENVEFIAQVCGEALRLKPVSPMVAISAKNDMVFGSLFAAKNISAGSTILCSVSSALVDPMNFPAARDICSDRPLRQDRTLLLNWPDELSYRILFTQVAQIATDILKLPGLRPAKDLIYAETNSNWQKLTLPEAYYLQFG